MTILNVIHFYSHNPLCEPATIMQELVSLQARVPQLYQDTWAVYQCVVTWPNMEIKLNNWLKSNTTLNLDADGHTVFT